MNNVTLIGRLTKDVELKETPNKKYVASITLAVPRDKEKTDFINCVVWNQSAEYLSKYASKGSKIGLVGSIQTRDYEGKNGKVYVTEVKAERVEILDSKEKKDAEPKLEYVGYENPNPKINGVNIEADELPFY